MPSSEIYTLSLHDALPIFQEIRKHWGSVPVVLHTGHVDGPLLNRALEWSPFTVLIKPCPMEQLIQTVRLLERQHTLRNQPPSSDRKSTRLNSSHLGISYAVLRDLHSFPTRRSSDLSGNSQTLGLRPRRSPYRTR